MSRFDRASTPCSVVLDAMPAVDAADQALPFQCSTMGLFVAITEPTAQALDGPSADTLLSGPKLGTGTARQPALFPELLASAGGSPRARIAAAAAAVAS